MDAQLNEYSGISCRIAKETKIELCNLRYALVSYLKMHNPENGEKGILTTDKVHLNNERNLLVAQEMLKTLNR